MIDEQCLRSIIASRDLYKDPRGAPSGYINILDMDQDPAAEDYGEGPLYDACGLIWMHFTLMHLRAKISRSVSSIGTSIGQIGLCILLAMSLE
jgi:hypothetical protein